MAVTVVVATPEALVVAVTVDAIPAPLARLAKVTVTPLSRLLPASFTVTESGVAKAVPNWVLWLLPEFTVTEAGGPGVLVSWRVVLALPAVTFTVYRLPAVALAVTVALATPEALVVAVGEESLYRISQFRGEFFITIQRQNPWLGA